MKLHSAAPLGFLLLLPLLLLLPRPAEEAPAPTPTPAVTHAPTRAPVTLQGSESGTMAYCNLRTGEAIVGNDAPGQDGLWWGARGGHDPLQTARDAAAPNTVSDLKTVPAGGITALRLRARLVGVALEPSASGQFELSYVGFSDTAPFPVTTEVRDGALSIQIEGADGQFYYVNTSADDRCNTLRVGVPAGILSALSLDCSTACVLVDGLDLPVQCDTGNAMVLVHDETRTQPLTMSCTNGSLGLSAGTVSGDVTLTATNGMVSLLAETVTGDLTLTAANGSVKAEADALTTARLRAENGSVQAAVGTVADAVYAGVSNGDLTFHLTRVPTDLTFHAQGWHLLDSLPDGWTDGRVFGPGGPELTLECVNGDADFTVG